MEPMEEVDPVDSHPTVLAFLDFLEREMERHPERLIPLTSELMERMMKVAEGIEVDLDEAIEGPVAL
ncbi:MAG TPA: type II toxin-antitoxin system PrlF family antitoxin [Longimicrobium sp.]|nr:type II toxin-antitoxin system PrlF family antitoxin [Longimicrobium sp.]